MAESNLRLGRDVKRGRGLVAEHDTGPAGQRDGDDDALLVRQDHARSRILHGPPEAGRTLSIYESDYDDAELPRIRSLIERDPRRHWGPE